MLCPRLLLLIGFYCFLTFPVTAQQTTNSQTVQRDPQAVQILTQALTSAGGPALLNTIQDYTGSGTANYYWGDGEQGTVVVKGRGIGQYRSDATLAEGTRIFMISNGVGSVTETDGVTRQIPQHNTLHLGSLTLPWMYLNSVVADPTVSITYVGLETKQNRQVHHIRTERVVQLDPNSLVSKLSAEDYFIDATTFLIVSTLDMVHPDRASNIDYPHEMQFANYQTVNGIASPFSIIETVRGNPSFSIQLNQLKFNVGLTDADFQP